MPRIEIIPDKPLNGDASPTIDVCMSCMEASEIEQGYCTSVYDYFDRHDVVPRGKIGSVDVDHPPYNSDDYNCLICRCFLNSYDD